jgi:hypothetical protein
VRWRRGVAIGPADQHVQALELQHGREPYPSRDEERLAASLVVDEARGEEQEARERGG